MRREQLPLLLGFCLGSLAWNVCWPFLPLRVQQVGVGDVAEVARISGFVAGGANLITAALGTFWAALGERFGYRLQIIRAHAGMGLSMGLIGLARVPIELIGATAVLGMLGGNYPHYMALSAARARPGEVARAVGDLQAAGQIGATIGPLIGGAVASQVGVAATFFVTTVISLATAGMIVAAVRPDAPAATGGGRSASGLRAAFARPEQRWLMLVMLIADLGFQGLRPLIPIFISLRIADPAAVAATTGVATTLVTGAGVLGALAVGRLKRLAPRTVLLCALPCVALAVAALPFATELPLLIGVWTLGGLASGAVTPSIFAWLGRISPSGGGFALLASTSMLTFAIGPALMGQLSVYGLEWPFRAAAVLTMAAVALVAARALPGRIIAPGGP